MWVATHHAPLFSGTWRSRPTNRYMGSDTQISKYHRESIHPFQPHNPGGARAPCSVFFFVFFLGGVFFSSFFFLSAGFAFRSLSTRPLSFLSSLFSFFENEFKKKKSKKKNRQNQSFRTCTKCNPKKKKNRKIQQTAKEGQQEEKYADSRICPGLLKSFP